MSVSEAEHPQPGRPVGLAEAARLAALHSYGVLDVPPAAELEALVRVAAAVTGVPNATLNLLDTQRQCQLTTVGFEGSTSPRRESLCAVAVSEGRAQHVPDARRDPRFAASSWVTGVRGWVRFYAAVPLTTPDGHTLGTLCVFDEVPRALSEEQMARLADCAGLVMAQLERSRMARRERDLTDEAVEQRAVLQLLHDELEERHELLDTVLRTAGVGIVVADAAGRLSLFNETARAWHDLDADPGVDPASFPDRYRLYRDDGATPLPAAEVPLVRALAGEVVDDVEMVIAPVAGDAVTVVCTGRQLTGHDGRSLGALVVMTDRTRQKRDEAALRASEERFRSAFQQAPNPIAVLSGAGRLLDANPAFCAWLGWSLGELRGRPAEELLHPDDRASGRQALRTLVTGEETSLRLERRCRRRDGGTAWARLSLAAVHAADGSQQLICQVEDIGEQRAVQQRLTELALHDHLTGLANRTLLLERLQHALSTSARDGSTHAVLFCDLDGFKAVNDTHGHAVGDEVLLEVSRRLSAGVRPSDTVARLGGDEFVVLCEHVSPGGEVTGILLRLEQVMTAPVPTSAGPVRVGLSVGVSHPGPGTAAADVLAAADADMYRAKQARRPPLPRPRGLRGRPVSGRPAG